MTGLTFSLGEVSQINDLITGLYKNVNKVDSLHQFLEKLQDICFFEKADVYIFRKTSGSKINFEQFIFSGWGEDLNYYFNAADMDDALPLISIRQPITFRSSDMFVRSERSMSRYYKDCLEPCNMYYSIEGNLYETSEEYICGMGLHRSSKQQDFSTKDVEIVKLCRPHLTEAVKIICDTNESIQSPDHFFISDNQHLAFAIYNWNLDLLETDINTKESLSKNGETICDVLYSMCNNLKQQIESDPDNGDTQKGTQSTLSVDGKSYYLQVSLTENHYSKDRQFSCFVYSYSALIDSLLSEKKEAYGLTTREYEVTRCLLDGLSNSEICDQLYISLPTVKKHTSSIYHKLGIEGRHQLFFSLFS